MWSIYFHLISASWFERVEINKRLKKKQKVLAKFLALEDVNYVLYLLLDPFSLKNKMNYVVLQTYVIYDGILAWICNIYNICKPKLYYKLNFILKTGDYVIILILQVISKKKEIKEVCQIQPTLSKYSG